MSDKRVAVLMDFELDQFCTEHIMEYVYEPLIISQKVLYQNCMFEFKARLIYNIQYEQSDSDDREDFYNKDYIDNVINKKMKENEYLSKMINKIFMFHPTSHYDSFNAFFNHYYKKAINSINKCFEIINNDYYEDNKFLYDEYEYEEEYEIYIISKMVKPITKRYKYIGTPITSYPNIQKQIEKQGFYKYNQV